MRFRSTHKTLLAAGLLLTVLVVPVASVQAATVSIPNPIACSTATCLIAQVVRYILGVIAILATLMFIWGGVMMLTSGGNSERVRQAKETLAWAAIGIVVIMLSWGIIRFVLEGLLNSSS